MQRTDVQELMVYAMQLWPRTFVVPQNEDELAMAEVVWMDVLGGLEAELIRAAMVRWNDHWPPSPKELFAMACDQASIENGIEPPPGIEDAWNEFRTNWRWDDEWSHPAVEAAAHSLGCKDFGQSPIADLMAWRAHFIKLYESAVQSHVERTTPLPPILERRVAPAIAARQAALG